MGLILILILGWGSIQANDTSHVDSILVQLPGASISLAEYEGSLLARSDSDNSRQHRSQLLLGSLIKLRQLSLAAQEMGFQHSPEFKSRLSLYINQADITGMLQRDIENWKLIEAFHRQQFVLNASHIVKSNDDSAPSNALQDVYRIRRQLLSGEMTFTEMAVLESDDPSAQENGGSFGYFSVFDHIYPLETAAYKTAVGSLSDPIKSRFGYHLIKVTSRDRIKGLKRASHIFIASKKSDGKDEITAAKSAIEQIYKRITATNFPELAKTYSEDYKTSVKGGDLGTDRIIDRVEAVKLALPVGAYSSPFQSSEGWHILKVTELQPFPSFMQARPLLKKKLDLDARVQREYEFIIKSDDPATIDSEIIENYIDNLLCSLILSRSSNIPLTKFPTRNNLIKILENFDMPASLSKTIKRFPAIIDDKMLSSVAE